MKRKLSLDDEMRFGTIKWRLTQKIRERFDDLEEFVRHVEFSLNKEKAATITEGELLELFYPNRLDDTKIERYQDNIRRYTDDFPRLLRSSSLTVTQSILESNLMAIGCFFAGSVGEEFDAKKINRGGRIWAVKEYLKNEHKILGNAIYWNKISDYVNIRNAITHGDGEINDGLKNPNAIEKSVKNLSSVFLDRGQIYIEASAVAEFANVSKLLCLDLLKGG